MRGTHPNPVELRPAYSAKQYLVAGLLCVAALVAMLAAVAYPAVVAAGLLAAGAVVVVRTVGLAVRARRRRDVRFGRQDTSSRKLCVPATGICLEA